MTTNPPKRGRPRVGLIDTESLVREVVKTYGIRNRRYIEWADEEEGAEPVLEEAGADDVEAAGEA